jgi:hypothetical protein
MTLADDLMQVVFDGRGIAGSLGFRPYRVYIVAESYTGQHTGEGGGNIDETEIVEGSNQPPKVRWLKDEEIAVGNLAGGTIEIGPITPAFSSGGTDLSGLLDDLERGSECFVRIVGPKHPNGAKYRLTERRMERALRYMLRAVPVANGE